MYLFSSDHDRHSKSMGKAVWNKKAQVKRSMPPFSQVCFLLIREFYLLEVMCSQEQIISANVVNKYFALGLLVGGCSVEVMTVLFSVDCL